MLNNHELLNFTLYDEIKFTDTSIQIKVDESTDNDEDNDELETLMEDVIEEVYELMQQKIAEFNETNSRRKIHRSPRVVVHKETGTLFKTADLRVRG